MDKQKSNEWMFKIGIEGLKGFCHGVDIDTYFKPKLRRCELYEVEIYKIKGGLEKIHSKKSNKRLLLVKLTCESPFYISLPS